MKAKRERVQCAKHGYWYTPPNDCKECDPAAKWERQPAIQCPIHGNFFEQGARCYICDGGTPIDQKVCCGAYRDCDCPKCQKSGLAKFNKVQPVVKTVETVSAPPDATDAQKQFVIWLNQYREERRND